MLLLAGVHP